jgi:hypothetical protein
MALHIELVVVRASGIQPEHFEVIVHPARNLFLDYLLIKVLGLSLQWSDGLD